MPTVKRPGSARLLATAILILGLLIGYLGLSANGYLVPAVFAVLMAALL